MSKQKYIYPGEEIGVYAFIFPNNKCYVGMTTRSFDKRWKDHLKNAKGNRHNTPYIQSYYNKHKSFENVEKIILEKWVAPDSLEELIEVFVPLIEEREVFWWEEMNNKGYVMVHGKPTGTGSVFHSDQSKIKTSNKLKSIKVPKKLKICPEEFCENLVLDRNSVYCSRKCSDHNRFHINLTKSNINCQLCLKKYKNLVIIKSIKKPKTKKKKPYISKPKPIKRCLKCNEVIKDNRRKYCSDKCSKKNKLDTKVINNNSEILTKKNLIQWYIVENRTTKEIERLLKNKVSYTTIRNYLIKYNIPLKSRGAMASDYIRKINKVKNCLYCGKEFNLNAYNQLYCSKSCKQRNRYSKN